ncbi:hypothetical protein U9M48_010047 [Paspalum notatum var. saurae]|uniref:Uncharacterized protein n=1 Tax=Paspalum notatum var. saurae TaxID=547442 RepID=A0AAQ3WG44_PASNO
MCGRRRGGSRSARERGCHAPSRSRSAWGPVAGARRGRAGPRRRRPTRALERRGLPALSSRRAALAAHSFVLLPVVLSVWCCVKAEGKVAVSSHRGLAFRGILGVEQFQDRAAHSCKQDSDALLFESWQGLLAYSPPQMLDDMLNVVVMEMGMPGFEQKRPFIVPDGIMMFTVSPCWTTVLGIT